jgi:2'-5' RNA ligase
MRLFIGIELPDRVRSAAVDAAERLRSAVSLRAPRSQVRWVPPPNLHVTVWFLGHVADARRDRLLDALRPSLPVPPFTMQIDRGGAFPPSGQPRVLWLGLTSGSSELGAIHQALGDRLSPLDFAAERRPYSPHLTLARVKEAGRIDGAAIRRAVRDLEVEAAAGDVAAVTLFRSEPSAGGSRYTALLRVPLS